MTDVTQIKNFHITPMLIGMQNWSKIRSKSDICHCFLLLFISISTITGCLIWYEKHESNYEAIELPEWYILLSCESTCLRDMIVDTGYYHMWWIRMWIHLLKAYHSMYRLLSYVRYDNNKEYDSLYILWYALSKWIHILIHHIW